MDREVAVFIVIMIGFTRRWRFSHLAPSPTHSSSSHWSLSLKGASLFPYTRHHHNYGCPPH